MRKMRKVLALLAVVVLPAAAVGIGFIGSSTTGLAPEAMREEMSGDILRTWAVEGAARRGVTETEWSRGMEPTLRNADIANLERAASAVDLRGMEAALMGNAVASASPSAIGSIDSDLVFTPVPSCRLVDTRIVGGQIAANSYRSYDAYTATDFTAQGGAASDCGLPADITAISVKITSVLPKNFGYFTVYPSNEGKPLASSLNFFAGERTSNQSIFRLCRPGCANGFTVYANAASGLVVDVEGYFTEPHATALDCTVAQESGVLDLLGGLQARSVDCPTGYTATGGGCGGALGIGVSNSQPVVTGDQPTGWSCDLVGSLLGAIAYQVNATCCRTPGR